VTDTGERPLKLFVWHGFGVSYTPGLAFAIARTKEEAREIVRRHLGEEPMEWGKCRVHRIEAGRCEINYGGA